MGWWQSLPQRQSIDADGDGVITRNEVHNYVQQELEILKRAQNERMEEWKTTYEKKLSAKEAEIEEWKVSYEELQEKYSELLENVRNEYYTPYTSASSTICKSSVEAAVKEILADPNLNLKKVPDWIEKRLYFNVVWVTLLIIQKIIGSVKVDALGHEFNMTMNPSV